MAIRISGVNLPDQKRVEIALTSIFGIGRPLSNEILQQLKISPNTKVRELTTQEENSLRTHIEKNIKVEGELKRDVLTHIKHHKDISSYRGIRHQRGLPVRGQQTRTNSRTVRHNQRRTAGSGRRGSAEKT